MNKINYLMFIVSVLIILILSDQVLCQMHSYNNNNSRIVKHPNNPIRWNYDSRYGSYYSDKESYSKNYNGIKHFEVFPVRYIVFSNNNYYITPIENSINEYKRYFPIQKVTSKTQADLFIYVLNYAEYIKYCSQTGSKTKPACTIQKYPSMNSGSHYKANIYVLEKEYKEALLKHALLHELGHAFGILNHSNNTNDILFTGGNYLSYEDGSIEPLFNCENLSPGDLNTLFIIYNLW